MDTFIRPNDIDKSLPIIQDNKELEVVTCINKSYYYFPVLLKSSIKYRYPLKIVGFNKPWVGYGTKLLHVYNLLNSYDSSYDNEYILVVDGSDVIFSDYYDNLLGKLKEYDYDIIISSSRCINRYSTIGADCLLVNHFILFSFRSKDENHIINAGLYVIKIKILRDIISKYIGSRNFESFDDQEILNIEINNTNYKYLIDNDYKYGLISVNFPNLVKPILKDIYNGNIRPYVIHLPGQRSMEDFIDIYLPDTSDEEKARMKPDQLYNTIKRIPYYAKLYFKNVKNDIIYMLIFWLLTF